MAENKSGKGQADGESRPPLVLEVLLLIWAVFGLGYFYYSQGFLGLLQELWSQAFG